MSSYYRFFRNLANPLKTDIISKLKEKDMSVTELVETLNVEQSNLSHALTSLKNCSIVISKTQGKQRIYSLNKKTILPILGIINDHERKFCKKCAYKK